MKNKKFFIALSLSLTIILLFVSVFFYFSNKNANINSETITENIIEVSKEKNFLGISEYDLTQMEEDTTEDWGDGILVKRYTLDPEKYKLPLSYTPYIVNVFANEYEDINNTIIRIDTAYITKYESVDTLLSTINNDIEMLYKTLKKEDCRTYYYISSEANGFYYADELNSDIIDDLLSEDINYLDISIEDDEEWYLKILIRPYKDKTYELYAQYFKV